MEATKRLNKSAVFLSYATEDAEAARRICDALRAAGIEVWFDQNELRGGDAWDASIRNNIKGCALFIALISSNAQQRQEGYFRREWRLAVDRTMDMADSRTFLLPVLIDSTVQRVAVVPEKFRDVQWTYLPEGNPTPEFVERVNRLITSDTANPSANLPLRAPHPPSIPTRTSPGDQPDRHGLPAKEGKRWLFPSLALTFVLLIALLGALYWKRSETGAPPHLSIVVLPFVNTSGDPNQEYVADAITDDITIELSRIKGSFVIGRGTAFSFKGKQIDLKEIARMLNVRYLLQGTAARSETKFHVTVQLIDGSTGSTIWADSIDSERSRVEEVRHDIVSNLANTLSFKLVSAEAQRAATQSNPDAIDLTMKAQALMNLIGRENDAEEIVTQALAIAPDYAPALVLKASLLAGFAANSLDSEQRKKWLAEGETAVARAIKIDGNNSRAYEALAEIRRFQGHNHEAVLANAHALELNPNFAESFGLQARLLVEDGNPNDAVQQADRAIALSPLDPDLGTFLWAKCYAHAFSGQFREALGSCEKSWDLEHTWYAGTSLVAAYEATGEHTKAENLRVELIKKIKGYSIPQLVNFYSRVDNPTYRDGLDKNILPNLRKAGVPEQPVSK